MPATHVDEAADDGLALTGPALQRSEGGAGGAGPVTSTPQHRYRDHQQPATADANANANANANATTNALSIENVLAEVRSAVRMSPQHDANPQHQQQQPVAAQQHTLGHGLATNANATAQGQTTQMQQLSATAQAAQEQSVQLAMTLGKEQELRRRAQEDLAALRDEGRAQVVGQEQLPLDVRASLAQAWGAPVQQQAPRAQQQQANAWHTHAPAPAQQQQQQQQHDVSALGAGAGAHPNYGVAPRTHTALSAYQGLQADTGAAGMQKRQKNTNHVDSYLDVLASPRVRPHGVCVR